MALTTKPNRFYPNIPPAELSLASLQNSVEQIRASIITHERRDNNYMKSFVRFEELVELGLINSDGSVGGGTGGTGGTGGSSFQTPWLSNIDGAGYTLNDATLTNIGGLSVTGTTNLNSVLNVSGLATFDACIRIDGGDNYVDFCHDNTDLNITAGAIVPSSPEPYLQANFTESNGATSHIEQALSANLTAVAPATVQDNYANEGSGGLWRCLVADGGQPAGLVAAHDLGSGDFTLETKIYWPSSSSIVNDVGGYDFLEYNDSGGGVGIVWAFTYYKTSDVFYLEFRLAVTQIGTGVTNDFQGRFPIVGDPYDAFYHAVAERIGNTVWIGWNGSVIGSIDLAQVGGIGGWPSYDPEEAVTVRPSIGTTPFLGMVGYGTGSNRRMDEIRLSKDGYQYGLDTKSSYTVPGDHPPPGSGPTYTPVEPDINIIGLDVRLDDNASIDWQNSAGVSVEFLTLNSGDPGFDPTEDPYWSNVGLYTKLNGTDGSTANFSSDDDNAHTLIPTNGAQIDTAQSKFGGSSILLDNTGAPAYSDYVRVNDYVGMELLDKDFTIEAWVRLASLPSSSPDGGFTIISHFWNASNERLWYFRLDDSNALEFSYSTDGLTVDNVCQTAFPFAIDRWYAVAAVREGNNIHLYVDGTRIGTHSVSGSVYDSYPAFPYIGLTDTTSGFRAQFDGWIDELRLTVGVARYIGESYTLQTSEFPTVQGDFVPVEPDGFIVGDPAYDTIIDGVSTTITGNAVVNGTTVLDQTLNVTGATQLASTLEVTGPTDLYSVLRVWEAAQFDKSMNVDGPADFRMGVTIWDYDVYPDGTHLTLAYSTINKDAKFVRFVEDLDGSQSGSNAGFYIDYEGVDNSPLNQLHFGCDKPSSAGTIFYIGERGQMVIEDNLNNAASLTSTTHPLQIGLTTGINLRFGKDEIQAVNNGAQIELQMQPYGGGISFFELDYSADYHDFQIFLGKSGATSGRFYLYSDSVNLSTFMHYVGNDLVWTCGVTTENLDITGWDEVIFSNGQQVSFGNFDMSDAAQFKYGAVGNQFATTFVDTTHWNITGLTTELYVDNDIHTAGDLKVDGTFIQFNSDAVDPPTEDVTLEVYRGGVAGTVAIRWNETTDKWEFTNDGSTYNDIGAGGGGGIDNVVEDLTPQLGGQLDVNGFALGDGTLELLTFTETASAVNHINLTNATTTNAPTVGAAGDDTDVGLILAAKGTGNISVGNFTFDADQTVGAGQDNYVLTYDDALGTIQLEAATGGGGGINNVVEDLTPQLGGNLDVQTFEINTSTVNGDVSLQPNGTGNVLLGNFEFDADQTVGAGQDNYVLTYDHSTTSISLEESIYDLGFFYSGKPTDSQEVFRMESVRAWTHPDPGTGSTGEARVASTGNVAFSVRRNGTQYATVTFNISASGTWAFDAAADENFAAGDTLTVLAPATADATLEDIAIFLKGLR